MVIQPALAPSPLVTKAFIHHGPWPGNGGRGVTTEGVIGFFVMEAMLIALAVWAHRRNKRQKAEKAKKQGSNPGRGPYLPTHYHHRHRRW